MDMIITVLTSSIHRKLITGGVSYTVIAITLIIIDIFCGMTKLSTCFLKRDLGFLN